MAERIQKLIIAFGRKGVGKTVETNRNIAQYVLGNPSKGISPRRVLVLDVNGEYEHIRTISLKDVRVFSAHPYIEARRIAPFKENGQPMTMDEIAAALAVILQNYRNGMLVLEDINRYTYDNMPGDLIGSLCANRHMNLDVVIHLQSVSRVTPKLWQNVNVVRFHPITDSIKDAEKKLGDKKEMFYIAEKILAIVTEASQYHFIYVDVENTKIRGRFTEEIRNKAIQEFIYASKRSLINPKVGTTIPSNTKKKYTELDVITEETARIIKKYF